MTTKININGDIHEEAFISILGHGFLFGDSVYEVICTVNGKPCFLDEHIKRLYASASGISLEIPSFLCPICLTFYNNYVKVIA